MPIWVRFKYPNHNPLRELFAELGTASFFSSPQFVSPQPNFRFYNPLLQVRKCTFKNANPLSQVRNDILRLLNPQP